MSAPSSQMPTLFSVSDPHLPARASFAPTSSAANPSYTWPSTTTNRSLAPRRSMVPPPIEQNGNQDGLLFITGTSLEDFKSRTNMTRVRKKAMGSYLKEKKPRESLKEHKHRSRGDSTGSRSSVGSDEQDFVSQSETRSIVDVDSRRKPPSSVSDQTIPELHRRETQESQISRFPRISMDFVLPSAPIVSPSREGIALAYDGTSPKPFQSIGKPLDPFRTMFQASHPSVSVEELKYHCSQNFGTKAMGAHWIPTMVKSPHAFLSTLCIASAHFDAVNERPVESVQTLALRQEVMHLISQNLLNPESRGDDYNVIALTQLIASEIITGEEMTLKFHETGIEAMIQQRGGIEKLGMNGRLASTLAWVSLESAILREAKPQAMYIDYCASSPARSYPNTATVPESPLYSPRNELETLKRSSRCSAHAIDILKDIRMMMDLFLHETKQSRHNSLSLKNIYKKITTQYPSVADLWGKDVLTSNDWKYEAIRIVAILTATSIIQRTHLSDALEHVSESEQFETLHTTSSETVSIEASLSPSTIREDSPVATFPTNRTNPFAFAPKNFHHRPPSHTSHHPRIGSTTALLTHLKIALQKSDLSDCWADMAGVLLWVTLTVGAASHKIGNKVLKKWYKAHAMRVSIVLCFEHPEAILASMLRMSELVESVGEKDGGGFRGKRMKS